MNCEREGKKIEKQYEPLIEKIVKFDFTQNEI